MRRAWIFFGLVVGMAASFTGCASNFRESLSGVAGQTDAAAAPANSPAEAADPSTRSAGRMQQQVMDFSDRFSNDLAQAFAGYIAAEPDIARQVRAQRLRLGLDSTAMTIAASLDPRANLLDMAVFISAGKWAADRDWIPHGLGEKAAALRTVYASADREIWEQVDAVLTPAQGADLRALIDEWKKTADPADVVTVRLRNLDGVVLGHFQESASAKGLLANVKRLLGKVDQSLLYGERMMFYLERTPRILSQQADLTVDRVAERFPIATVDPDFAAWSQAAQDFGRDLPQRFRDALAQNEGLLRDTLPGIQTSLTSVDHITASLQGTVTSADSLAEKIGRLPFDSADYAIGLERANASLDKINAVLLGLNQLLDQETSAGHPPRVEQLAQLIDDRAERAMDAIYHRAAMLIALFIGGLLLVLVVARLLFPRRPVVVAAPANSALESPAEK